MKINIEDIKVTDEMVCNFVDGTSAPEQERMILAKMRIDREFAREVRDLMDAMNAIPDMEEDGVTREEYPYAAAAFASFATDGADQKDYLFSSSPRSADDLADDFLDSCDEDADENTDCQK